jgi:alkanesulfonate monooxygenase SsuD/methylene tetrahydromethanopterin reductase-like flavin-dependent oxidoreductase (luciferase family)
VTLPFAPGSVSLGLHAIEPRDGPGQAEAIVEQALAAERAGFAGVTLSEHHGAFPGYMGQPLLAATWILAATRQVWAGPAPYLLSLRNPILVAEELAWTAARFPGRVGAALAPGYAKADYDLLGLDFEGRAERFDRALETVLETLSAGGGGLGADPAVVAWRQDPGVILTAGNSRPGARRAARAGTGLLLPGGGTRERYRELIGLYRDGGGAGPVVKIRQIWMGAPPPGSLEARDAVYKQAASKEMRQAQGFAEPFLHGGDEHVLAELSRDIDEFGLDAINVRFHLAEVSHEQVLEQIARFGDRVLPRLPIGQPA